MLPCKGQGGLKANAQRGADLAEGAKGGGFQLSSGDAAKLKSNGFASGMNNNSPNNASNWNSSKIFSPS
ncbi:MAG: hypothetical protein EBY15_09110 [Gammaproteobacteria bacterium]|nr:hypothetical protein [Gammaproteobacteria bacterium]